MDPVETIPRELFSEERLAYLLCYPRPNNDVLLSRIQELDRLEISAIKSFGPEELRGIRILGKGCVSVVVLAQKKTVDMALKIRRVDADRSDMDREVHFLKMANKVDVGPKLIDYSPNFILMDYVKGLKLREWLQSTKSKSKIKNVLYSILNDCRKLDSIGLDHGELSAAHKHVLITKKGKPIILDFESASTSRKLSNVTSICQYLFIGGETAQILQNLLEPFDKDRLIEKLRKYKITLTQEAFEDILNIIGLERKH